MNAPRAFRSGLAAVGLSLTVSFGALAEPAPPPASPAAAASVETPTARVANAFAFRSPREGKPAEALSRREGRRLDDAVAALRRGDLARAEKLLNAGSAMQSVPYRTGVAYLAIRRERLDAARELLTAVAQAEPKFVPALEALADLAFAEGRTREALEAYRRVLAVAPADARAKERAGALVAELVRAGAAAAEAALRAKDPEGARRLAFSLLELDARSPEGYDVLSRVAEARGQLEDAYASALTARALDDAPKRTQRVAELATRTRRFSEAATLFSMLAERDPSFRARAEQARLEEQIQGLPELARRAALSPKLTRAQAAALLVAVVPEVRDAPAPAAPDVATDALGRPESSALVRAIALGFFAVNKETHRVGADAAVSRAELAALAQRLAAHVARGRPLPGCLSAAPALAALEECGILSPSSSRTVGGREALFAFAEAARAGRQGGAL